MPHELWLIRHGETEWSLSGAHTGRTDLPLLETGREQALATGRYLAGRPFALVLTSPLQRARETCRLAGYGAVAQLEPDLMEWDYGAYEGVKTPEIRQQVPDWSIWRDGVKDGETIEQVAARADRVIERSLQADGDVALFGHGHILRVLAARYMGLAPQYGRYGALSTAGISTFSNENGARVITRWNFTVSE